MVCNVFQYISALNKNFRSISCWAYFHYFGYFYKMFTGSLNETEMQFFYSIGPTHTIRRSVGQLSKEPTNNGLTILLPA